MNIKFYHKRVRFFSFFALLRVYCYGFLKILLLRNKRFYGLLKRLYLGIGLAIPVIMFIYQSFAYSASLVNEPIQACVVAREVDLTNALRAKFAQCLGWELDPAIPVCFGSYQPVTITPLKNPDEVRILADTVSFYKDKRSTLSGHVEVQQDQQVINAQTAYVYRDPKTNQITKIELLGAVRYLEPDKLMIARKATINPQDHSGQTEDVLYRFNTDRSKALLPAWGRASLIERFANQDFLLRKATYTTCAPQDKSWDITADSIKIDQAKAKGIARNAVIRLHNWPVFYTPYLSFPTNRERKSGFLMPLVGYSNIGGYDFGLPYYWNIAPNYDLTFVPHAYTRRGVMAGGDYRFLTASSVGTFTGNFLPQDKAYSDFLHNNETQFPRLQGVSTNRWSLGLLETTNFTPDLQLNMSFQQVSDDYYFQDFSTNLAVITQRQLLRQADLKYSTEHWIFRGMGQSYQTLQPVNEGPIAPAYERLPQVMAQGFYDDLPFNANLNILGQYDQFHWPTDFWNSTFLDIPQGPRFHFNPVLTIPVIAPWGYITPSAQFVENFYQVDNSWGTNSPYYQYNLNYNSTYNNVINWGLSDFNFNRVIPGVSGIDYNRFIPRYSLDSGLYFDRYFKLNGNSYTQTLEPRLFYLRVPYQDQTPIPVYDSGFMIFNMDQLFRTNRFSGFDRIGDANQLSYALTSRWLSEESGAELASVSIGQIKYFSDRKVQLCQSPTGVCIDSNYTFGSLSSVAQTSPIASRAVYHFNNIWDITGDYMWNPATRSTNNADLNLHYQPESRAIVNIGYSYLTNSDEKIVNNLAQNNSLHQALLAFAWPVTPKWSAIGAYSYNISQSYNMMSLFGVQYDSCCWAMRVMGGKTFDRLNAYFEPQYNSSVYLQVLLKGLGTVAYSDPMSVLSTYLPGYNDSFH